jgi:hypothetical protein
MKASDLVNLIRAKYETNSRGFNPYVILEQVPDGTGGYQNRWIDVAVFQMWPSKGLSRSAFEVKIDRADFIHELSHPEKHQWCKDCFHQFWIVAPKDIVQIEELPIGVGNYPLASCNENEYGDCRVPNSRLYFRQERLGESTLWVKSTGGSIANQGWQSSQQRKTNRSRKSLAPKLCRTARKLQDITHIFGVLLYGWARFIYLRLQETR